MVMLAFVLDFGRAYFERTRLQSAVDAAALAGAQAFCEGSEDPVAVAVDYAQRNGVTVQRADVTTYPGNTRYISVLANSGLQLLFGPFVGADSIWVSARATASRLCQTKFQFVADNWFQFTSSVSVQGPIFAGKCFNASQQSTYNSLIVVSSPKSFDCNIVNSSYGKDPVSFGGEPVDATSDPTNPRIIGPDHQEPIYGQTDISAASAYEQSAFYADTGPDPLGTYAPSGPCSRYGGDYSSRLSCTGDIKPNASDTIRGWILSNGEIDLSSTQFAPGGAILIYSSSISDKAIRLPNDVPSNVMVYAPAGQVTFNGSDATMKGTIFANRIQTNGGGADAAAGSNVQFAGPISLTQ